MKNVRASSLVEVLVSSVILSLTLSVAFFIFINVTRTAPSTADFKWSSAMDTLLRLDSGEAVNTSYQTNLHDDYRLLKTVTAHTSIAHLYKVQVSVLDGEQRVIKEKSAWVYRYESN